MRRLNNMLVKKIAVIIAIVLTMSFATSTATVFATYDTDYYDYGFEVDPDYFEYGDWDYYDATNDSYYQYDDEYGYDADYGYDSDDISSNEASTLDYVTKKNESTGYSVMIYDGANLLSDSEEKKLVDIMYPITDEGHVVLYTTDYSTYKDIMKEASRVFFQLFNDGTSATMFMINMDVRELVVFSDGKIHKTITDDYGYTITDNVYTYASSGDYFGCAKEAFGMIITLLNDGAIAQPMKNICNFFIAINLGFFVCYLIAHSKSKASKASSSEMLKYAVINISNEQPNVILTNTTKRYVPRSSGGGHGGGHSGGGHSGGGGHHGF